MPRNTTDKRSLPGQQADDAGVSTVPAAPAAPAANPAPSGRPFPPTAVATGEDPTYEDDVVAMTRVLWAIGLSDARKYPENAQAIMARTGRHVYNACKLSDDPMISISLIQPGQPVSMGEAEHNTLSPQPLSAAPITQPASQQQSLLSASTAQPSSGDQPPETRTHDWAYLPSHTPQTPAVPQFSSGHQLLRGGSQARYDTISLGEEGSGSQEQRSVLHRRQETARTCEKLSVG